MTATQTKIRSVHYPVRLITVK